MSAYVKIYDDETKWMHFLVKDDELLKKYNDIWNKVSNNIEKKIDSELIYNRKIKTDMESYEGKTTKSFHDKEIPKENVNP